jgi:hypothetical protein
MSESVKRTCDDESEDSSDGCIGPMPSETAKPKKRKCKSFLSVLKVFCVLVTVLNEKGGTR